MRKVRDQDLFLAQKIEVGVTAGTRIDDGGKIPGKIVGVALVTHGKSKGNLQRDLGGPDKFSVSNRERPVCADTTAFIITIRD